ncbi:MAG: thioredoxin family protein [Phycisphaerales bacterium]|nr:thioredoxin family protein [Phycisphaerales bacterium]
MARTPSTMLMEIGEAAPDFALPDTQSNHEVTLDSLRGTNALVVMFICNHCPYVKHLREALATFGRDMAAANVAVVAINSNDVQNYPDDRPELMAREAEEAGYTFPYLYDESQEVAKAYRAACTPDFFLFDAEFRLAYRGQFDDSRPGNEEPVTGASLRRAVEAVLQGDPVPASRPSLGCNIKWRAGREPAYLTA